MSLVLYTSEQLETSLSHGAILCTVEQMDNYYLMHYRTKGSKNGVRRYQNEDGSLTSEGYQHYADMYGWNKRLNKAQKYQDRADRADQKVQDLSRKLAEAKVKSDRANLKMIRYNDKLARKDEKMQKYVNEDGSLNDKALNKYTYTTGVPGERKMSLVGRLKFGNEYSNKFNEDSKNKATEKLRKSVPDAPANADRKTLEKAWEDSERKKFDQDEWNNEAAVKLANKMKNIDSLSSKEKIQTGDEVLRRLKNGMEDTNLSDDAWTGVRAMQDWLVDQVYDKAGSINAGEYKTGTNAAKANEAVEATWKQLSDREDQIKKEIGYKSYNGSAGRNDSAKIKAAKKERERLETALRKDSVWSSLDKQYSSNMDNVMGAILKDLGFSDTPSNRSILYAYGWWD